MLLKPRRLPERFNRRIQVSTRRFVEQRHKRHRQYRRERWGRVVHRLQRQSATLRKVMQRFLLIFIAGLLILTVSLLLFSPLLAVKEMRVLRTDPRIDVERVQRALVPAFRRHLFFLSGQEIEALLQQDMPDLLEVTIAKRYPSTLVLRLTLDPIIARLSIEDPPAQGTASSGTGVLTSERAGAAPTEYLTARGMDVLYPSSQVKVDAIPLIRIVDWGVRPSPWRPLLDPELLLLMREAEQALREQFGQEVTERTVFLRAQEFHVRTKPLTLWFDRRSSLAQHLDRYRIFLRTVGMQGAKQYVDLRLTDRIVYR